LKLEELLSVLACLLVLLGLIASLGAARLHLMQGLDAAESSMPDSHS